MMSLMMRLKERVERVRDKGYLNKRLILCFLSEKEVVLITTN